MLGIESNTQRECMDESLGIIIRLLTEEEPITYESEWFQLRDAQFQLKAYQPPTMPIPPSATISPKTTIRFVPHTAFKPDATVYLLPPARDIRRWSAPTSDLSSVAPYHSVPAKTASQPKSSQMLIEP